MNNQRVLEKLRNQKVAERRRDIQYSLALGVQLDQMSAMQFYRRGWSRRMVFHDNLARTFQNLPIYEDDSGPVADYVWAAQGKDEAREQRLAHLANRFGNDAVGVVRNAIATSIEFYGGNAEQQQQREIYVPPFEYTYAMMRLDDRLKVQLPLFSDSGVVS